MDIYYPSFKFVYKFIGNFFLKKPANTSRSTLALISRIINGYNLIVPGAPETVTVKKQEFRSLRANSNAPHSFLSLITATNPDIFV